MGKVKRKDSLLLWLSGLDSEKLQWVLHLTLEESPATRTTLSRIRDELMEEERLNSLHLQQMKFRKATAALEKEVQALLRGCEASFFKLAGRANNTWTIWVMRSH